MLRTALVALILAVVPFVSSSHASCLSDMKHYRDMVPVVPHVHIKVPKVAVNRSSINGSVAVELPKGDERQVKSISLKLIFPNEGTVVHVPIATFRLSPESGCPIVETRFRSAKVGMVTLQVFAFLSDGMTVEGHRTFEARTLLLENQ